MRGRSFSLRINYRTSHQIRAHADRLLPQSIADVDGITESRRETVSVFDGPQPELRVAKDQQLEIEIVAAWIVNRLRESYRPEEIGLFVRSEKQLERARRAVAAAGAECVVLGDEVAKTAGKLSVSTMHLAKGLEFRGFAIMACDDDILPLQERVEAITDAADLEEV